MKSFSKISVAAVLWICVIVPLAGGCHGWQSLYRTPKVPPLGAQSDAIWQRQEANAEASDFVVYQHEFELDGIRLNMGGEDHLKAIAARLKCGADFPVVVERSMTSLRPESEYTRLEAEVKYPVHPNPELDMRRRDIVVRSLVALGVNDADQRVLVAPPLASGYTAIEAVRAYHRGINQTGSFGAGRGGFGGAWFGGGATGGAGAAVR